MRKLFEIFKVLRFQKRIVAAATIWGNTVNKWSYAQFLTWGLGIAKLLYTLFAPRVTMRSVWTVSYYCLDERGDGAVANFEKKSRTVGFTNWAHLGRDCFAKIAISSQAKSKKKRNNFGYLCAIKISDKRNSCTSHISLRVI